MNVYGVEHVQLAMPAGGEMEARAFYGSVLQMEEVFKPANLSTRGGAWFQAGTARLHLGVEGDFRPARKAHPALLVRDLAAMVKRCRTAGFEPWTDEVVAGVQRAFVADPFGNRIELMQPDAEPGT